MNSLFRKSIAIVLMILMLISAMSTMAFANEETPPEYEYFTLTPGEPFDAAITESGQTVYFSFTPEESGFYIFNSSATEDAVGFFYDENMNVDVSDDDSGDGSNFAINAELSAGETYYFGACFWDDNVTGTLPVLIKKINGVTNIELKPIEVVAGTTGDIESAFDEQGEYVEYYRYYWQNALRYTVTLESGDIISGNGSGFFDPDGNYFTFETVDGQDYTNPWTVGNSYPATLKLMNYEMDVTVSIIDCPVESITIEPLSLVENFDGNINQDYTVEGSPEYFYYDWLSRLSYIVELNDGTILNGIGSSVYDENGDLYGNITYSDTQGYNNQWTKGNTYTATISFLGYESIALIRIVGSPIESIDVDPIEIIEGTHRYSTSYWDEELQEEVSYEYYYWEDLMSGTVHYKDGSSYRLIGTWFYDEEGNHIGSLSYMDDQCAAVQWTAGNTYSVHLSYQGYETDIPVTILESPVESIVFDQDEFEIIENTNGSYCSMWDDEAQDNLFYYEYQWRNDLSYTITLKDGTVYRGSGTDVYDEDVNYIASFQYSDAQSPTNQWTAGNTYSTSLFFMGYEAPTISVTILETPVKSVDFSPVSVIKNTNGSINYGYDSDGNEHEYFHYSWLNNLSFTITMKDDTVINGSGDGFYDEDGEYHTIYTLDHQGYDNQWDVGSYTPKAYFLGYEAEIPVSIIDVPIKSISAKPLYLNANDYREFDGFNEDGEFVTYPFYEWEEKCELIITLADDSTQTIVGYRPLVYLGEEYYPSFDGEQSADHYWEAGGSYAATATIMGVSCEIEINIALPQTENGISYLDMGEYVIIVDVDGSGDVLTLPEIINDKPVVAVSSMSCIYKEIIFPDSVTSISGNVLMNCPGLEKVTFGAGIPYLDQSFFYDCGLLEEIHVSEENANYCSIDGVLYNKEATKMIAAPCGKTSSHTVPATAEDIEVYFENVFSFTIQLQNGSTGYLQENGVIYDEDKTTVISCDKNIGGTYTMPDTVESIRRGAFAYSSFEKVVVSPKVTSIVYGAFEYNTKLQEIVLPEGLKSIGFHAFTDCASLSKIELPEGLETIAGSAFKHCSSLTELTLPESLIAFEPEAFAYSGLTKINIPSKIEGVSGSAFIGTPLTEVTFAEGPIGIGSFAFKNTKLKSITLPESLEFISYEAFYNTPLESIDFRNVIAIGEMSFAKTKLNEIKIPATLREIGEYAFEGCSAKTLKLAEGITQTPSFGFGGLAIESLSFPTTVTDIGYYSFSNCTELSKIDLPDNLQKLSGTAFHNTAWYNAQDEGRVFLENALYRYKGTIAQNSHIGVFNGTKIIASYAFESQSGMKSVYLPADVRFIGLSAFYECTGLTDVYYAGSEQDLEQIEIEGGNSLLLNADWHFNHTCSHKYTNSCDTTCNTCNAKRTIKHTYTNACDKSCNVCKATRVTSHSYKKVVTKATLTANGKISNKCEKCGYIASSTTTIRYPKTFTLSATSYTYDGKVKTPSVTVKDTAGKVLKKDTDYTVTYASGRKLAGTYKVTIKMKGNYSGTKTLSFKINPISISKCKVSISATSYTYNGKVKTPTVTVKNANGTKLVKNTHYTVTYSSGRKNVGSYKVTVKMKGNYSGSKTLTFKINPVKSSISKLVGAKKAFTVTVAKKSTQVTGYQIQYSTSKKFTSAKTKSLTSYKTTKATIKSLSAKKTYYVRVRTYKTVSGVKYYSGWSAYKAVKTK